MAGVEAVTHRVTAGRILQTVEASTEQGTSFGAAGGKIQE